MRILTLMTALTVASSAQAAQVNFVAWPTDKTVELTVMGTKAKVECRADINGVAAGGSMGYTTAGVAKIMIHLPVAPAQGGVTFHCTDKALGE